MKTFSQFMQSMESRYDLEKKVLPNSLFQYHITLPQDTQVVVACHEWNEHHALVWGLFRSLPKGCDLQWYAIKALNFNRSALHHLTAAATLDKNRNYGLIWSVPRRPFTEDQWYKNFNEFEMLHAALISSIEETPQMAPFGSQFYLQ